ncbi:MAG: acyl-CoA dehydrogenase [Acidobacteriota bacterium]|nr:acyl-CoA dehydrogenase [Acidobacteriota bacterium]
MTHYNIDERDIMFNLKECPGLEAIQQTGAFEECDTETVDMIYETSANFCQKVLAPLLMPTDREGLGFKNGQVTVPEGMVDAWEQYRELDLIGINSEPEFGGAGLPHFFSAPVTEMECGSFVSFSMLPLLTRGAARLILSFGNDELKNTYVAKMFSGEWSGTMCLTEPDAGSDVGAGVTSAEPEGDHYKITGTKTFISWGEHNLSDNIIHLVLARIKGAPAGSKGLSLFVVPKNRVDADGNITGPNDVTCSNIEHKMGIKSCPTCVINFGSDNNTIGYLLGEAGYGMRYMFQMMNEARLEVGVQGMGQASAAYLSAVNYAAERVQGSIMEEGGPRPAKIIEHPDVRRMLVKMRALVQGSRAMIYHLTQYLDLAHHGEDKAKYKALSDLLTPVCKSYGSDQGFRVTEMAIQTFGGYGYCQDYAAEQYMRDSKISSLYEGTNGIQAMDLVFRKILMNKGENLKVFGGEAIALVQATAGSDLASMGGILKEGIEAAGATAAHFGQRMASGEHDEVRFHATDFQEHFGHVVVGYFLLKQALVASRALTGDVSDADRTFYEQKIVTARYFFDALVVPAIKALEIMRSPNVAGLQAEFV